MVRFSCFQAHIHSHKQKKMLHPSAEAMKKTLEDAPENQAPKNFSYLAAAKKPYLKEERDRLNNISDHVTDSSPSLWDCSWGDIESKYHTDCDIAGHKNAQIKKSQSLGSGLNQKGRTFGVDGSDDEVENELSYDGSAVGINDHGLSVWDQFQELVPSDSVRVNSDFAKNDSIFSLGDPPQSEKEAADKDGIHLSGSGDSDDHAPHILPVIVKSISLPSMASPNQLSSSIFLCSRSAEDLNALDPWKNDMMHEVGRKLQNQVRDDSINDGKSNGEIPVDDTYEIYKYVGSAKDWIIPEADGLNMERSMKVEDTPYYRRDELPTKDFRLKRIQEWVIDLQHSSPLEESNEFSSYDDRELPKGNTSLEERTTSKLEVKVNPGMEAAKRYISSLTASATAAQLTNLGLVMIPFLSAFVSLKVLNLSGNAIVRITSGTLPRGLHILNLSKNNISTIEGLRDLTRLRVLDLSYDRMLRIGHGLASCSSIKELYLAGNKINEVEGLHRLQKLNVLDMRCNKISTTKCLGQLAANYNCLQALSLEGNPAQKNVGDEQLKKYVQSFLPHLTYYNRQCIKAGKMKDTADRSARIGITAHQIDRGPWLEVNTTRTVSSSPIHSWKSQMVVSQKLSSRSRLGRLAHSGMETTTNGHHLADFSSKLLSFRNDLSIRRSQSEGTLGAL